MNFPYLAALALFSVGLYCILVKRDLFKIIYGICLMGYSINLLLISLGYVWGGTVPIISGSPTAVPVDPLLQAMVITAIVIEFAAVALMVSVAIRLFEQYRSTDVKKIRRLRG